MQNTAYEPAKQTFTYGYGRVSSKDQNIDRQVKTFKELGIDKRFIYIDKASGKDFERPHYQELKRRIAAGDLLVIDSLDRFGRDWEMILDEWREIHKVIGADIQVLDCPILDTRANNELSDLFLLILAYFAQLERRKIKERQRQGIEAAQAAGKHLGRHKVAMPDNFADVHAKWRHGSITAVEAMKILGLKKDTFYRFAKQFEQNLSAQ